MDNKILYKIFNKKQIEPSGRISMKGLVANRLVREEKQHQRMEVERQKESDEEESEGEEQKVERQGEPSEVQQIIRSMEIEENKERLVELVTNYYTSPNPGITSV